MKAQLTETARKVIEVLTRPGRKSSDHYHGIEEVDQIFKDTMKSVRFIQDLEARKLIHATEVVHHGTQYQEPEWSWKEAGSP